MFITQNLLIMRKYFLILFSVFFLCITLSCNCKKNVAGIPVLIPKEIKNINFFLETSASMGGYMKGNSDFVKKIPNFLVDIEGRIKSKNAAIKINYIADSITEYKGSTRDFIQDISTIRVATGNSSPMHKIFESVTNATDSNDISILVSDCILSFSDPEIKKNPKINIEKADGALKVYVKQAFIQVNRKNVCATVYGFSSSFFGTYYCYNNDKVQLNGELRPYYMWVIGNKDLVQQFNKQLTDMPGFAPELSISFGMFSKPIAAYTLLFTTGKSGEWTFDNNSLKDVSVSTKKPGKFSIAVDFSALPEYAKEINYLKNNLKVTTTDLKAAFKEIKKASEIDLNKTAPKEKGPLQAASHVIIIEVSDIYQSSGTVTLKLPLRYDKSYEDWSVMDDKNVKTLGRKTFAFEHLVDGVLEAYENKNDNYIDITINLKK